MRLGQLARKLSIRQQDIVEFLSSQKSVVEDGSNTRLSDHQVGLLMDKFAPGSSAEERKEVIAEKEEEVTPAPELVLAEPISEEPEIAEEPSEQNAEAEQPELIKAPKIELQGLKVLGKIELPEAKKKAEATSDVPEPLPSETRKPVIREERRPAPNRAKPQNRSSKNPIAQAREREAEEQQRKRDEAAELAKERRTQNYHKKIKAAPPTRRAQVFDEQVEEISASENERKPKGFWGKVKQWFKS